MGEEGGLCGGAFVEVACGEDDTCGVEAEGVEGSLVADSAGGAGYEEGFGGVGVWWGEGEGLEGLEEDGEKWVAHGGGDGGG